MLALNALYITRLPDAEHDTGAGRRSDELLNPGALRNRGFLVLMTCDGVLGTNQVLLNVVIPLWLVEETDAPRVLLAWLFGTNTVMAVLLQVAAARGRRLGATGRCAPPGSSAAFFVLSCLIVLVTHDTLGWVTIALVWLGHVTVTGAELFQSAASWGFQSELSDPDRRGEYQGAAHIGHTARVGVGARRSTPSSPWSGVRRAGWSSAASSSWPRSRMRPSARAAERFLAAGRDAGPRGRPCLNPPVATPAAMACRCAAAHPARRGRPRARRHRRRGVRRRARSGGRRRSRCVVSLALQVGVNYANDYSDGIRGTDDDRVGPMRLVGSGAAAPAGGEGGGVPRLRGRRGRRAGAGRHDRLVAGRRRRRLRGGGVVLHRRHPPLRLPRRSAR